MKRTAQIKDAVQLRSIYSCSFTNCFSTIIQGNLEATTGSTEQEGFPGRTDRKITTHRRTAGARTDKDMDSQLSWSHEKYRI